MSLTQKQLRAIAEGNAVRIFESSQVSASAARGGHLQVLKWLHENKSLRQDEWTCACAASCGRLEVCI